jgi:ubiquinone/menaquinone biosynthesis C-methylase UbiE
MRRANGVTGAVWRPRRDGAAELWFIGGRQRCRATLTLHRWLPGQLNSEADESVHSADAYPLDPLWYPKTCAAISCLQYCRVMTVSRIAHPSKSIGTASWFQKVMVKYWYPFLTRRWDAEDVVLLNYGYEEDPPMGLPLAASDERNRYNIQLYHCTATQADLSGKQVLEVSCGHGGGASYLVRTLGPASYTGLDLNADAIAFCRKRHSLPGLDFVHGDAQSLPFADESFDAVINVEASHGYSNFPRFLAEVVRVLRPGGRFQYADFRSYLDFSQWEAAMADAPMRLLSERVINAEVLRGLDNLAPRYLDLVGQYLPPFLRPFGRLFVGAPGSLMYRELQRGRLSYRMYCFAKD